VIEIARRGHSIENHSHTHSNLFAFYGPGRMRREVDLAQATMRRITGRAPQFFRAPAGFRNPLLDPLLVSRGLRYVSWTRRGYDGVSNNAGRIRDRLIRGLAAGDVLLLHDSRRIVLDVLPHVLEEVKRKRWRCVTLPAACGDDGAEERTTSAHAVHG
jgi:peptidoglycan/xylan/chitin deacetylase (PgdA/CDA1 family)